MLSIEAKLRNYLQEISLYPGRVSQLGLQDSLFAGGILDSLSLLRLVSYVEQEFGLTISLGDISVRQFGTLEGIIHYIEQAEMQG